MKWTMIDMYEKATLVSIIICNRFQKIHRRPKPTSFSNFIANSHKKIVILISVNCLHKTYLFPFGKLHGCDNLGRDVNYSWMGINILYHKSAHQ